jgi:hypothetical protein
MMREIDDRELVESWSTGSATAGAVVITVAANARTLRRVMREPPNNPEE